MVDYYKEFETYLIEKKHVSDNTLESYMRDIGQFLSYLKGKGVTDPTEADNSDIRTYISDMEAAGRSHSTVMRVLASIRCYYQYLVFENVIAENPAMGIKLAKIEKKLPSILTGQEIDLLLAQPDMSDTKGARDKAMLELLYATGLRVTELIDLNMQDINLSIGILHCASSKNERIIPIYPGAVKVLEHYITKARPLMVMDSDEKALFTNINGTRLTGQGFWKIIKAYTKQADIKKNITPHTMRHSFATHMLENGAQLKDIQELLGHANISSTQVYAHIMKDRYANIYKKYHPRAK